MTAVITRMVQIPTPATNGYVNAGDIVILFSSYYAGPLAGFFIGGVGSALADILTGYQFYYVTFIIKGLEGFIAGFLPRYLSNIGTGPDNFLKFLTIISMGAFIMVTGYFGFHVLAFGPPKAYASLPGNIFQAFVGVIGALALFKKGPSKLLINIYQNNVNH